MNTKVHLPYGETSIRLSIPNHYGCNVLEPKDMKSLRNPTYTLKESILNPIGTESLFDLAKDSKNPCIIISDSTRPTPSGPITEAVIDVLNKAGVPDDRVKVVVATGLHRPSTEIELVEIMGTKLLRRVTVVNHSARDKNLVEHIGYTTLETPVWINKEVLNSDLVIGDGYIEPHFFAGYTGGGKNILPGVSGLETIKANHGAEMIDHPKARAGILKGNPIYMDIVQGARMTGYDFSVNVTLNSMKKVSGIFTGDFEEAHLKGCNFLKEYVGVKTKPTDIVVTTNGGYPLDRDLYQAVKGMTVGETCVKEGGVVIVVSECRDGIGHPEFKKLVEESRTPEEILETVRSHGFFMIDQWQAQTLARVLQKAQVIFVTGGVVREDLRKMLLTPSRNLEDAVKQAIDIIGRDPEINIVPGGPSTIPLLV